MITWRNKAFQVCKVDGGIQAHMVDDKGVIVFRWRMYYDTLVTDDTEYEEINIPFGVIEHFETFKALCRQFDTPHDLRAWYLERIKDNDR